METPAFNGERRRSKTRKRRNWASALFTPRTMKALITGGKWLVEMTKLVLALVQVFRE